MLVTFVFRREYCDYDKLLRVWQRSAARHMPGVERRVIEIDPPQDTGRLDDITHAFLAAIDYVLEQGRDCIVCDADMMFCGNMMDAFNTEFDIAVTVRDARTPYNTGVWFYRETPEAREFMKLWRTRTEMLIANKSDPVIGAYGGLDQASLALAIMENTSAVVAELPCALYNAEQSCWGSLSQHVKAVHIKSELRDVCLGSGSAGKKYSKKRMGKGYLKPIAKQWRSYL